jgi:hypothetical protein
LEKVEIGGIKGKALSTLVVKIFEEFREEFEKFGNQKYDVLDPGSDVEKMNNLTSLIFNYFNLKGFSK